MLKSDPSPNVASVKNNSIWKDYGIHPVFQPAKDHPTSALYADLSSQSF